MIYLICMKSKEVEIEIKRLQSCFDRVRLLRENEIPSDDVKNCECYKFWNREYPCAQCISRKTLRTKKQKTKIEFLGDAAYFVMTKYIDVDGRPCVIEMSNRMDSNSLVDSYGRKRMIEQLESYEDHLYKDILTGIYNHNYYEEEARFIKGPMGVAKIDIDDFKEYNDRYGLSAGDDVLQMVAGEIRKYIRKTDILIRFGGDEFVLIVPGISNEIFENKLNQIKNHLHSLESKSNAEMPISLSAAGVVTYNKTVEQALVYVERLLDEAKEKKNTVIVGKDTDFEVSQTKEKQSILVVDDSEMNREILSEMLKDEFEISFAQDGRECIQMISNHEKKIDLILLDIIMPNVDGFGVLDYMSRHQYMDDIPVIMISSDGSKETIHKAYEMQVSDYISRPFDKKVVYRRVRNAMALYNKQKRLSSLVSSEIHERDKNNRMMMNILSHIVEFRNKESGGHVLYLQTITSMLLASLIQKTNQYDLNASQCNLISLASVLHDIGKIGIPEVILNKPGKLTHEEFEIMKTHTTIGADILDNLKMYQDEPLVKYGKEICLGHHERWDGQGYPNGLKEDEIPISAQVVSIADCYDALVGNRVYKPPFTHEEAIKMILTGQCGQFNPLLVECLSDIGDQLKLEVEQNKKGD